MDRHEYIDNATTVREYSKKQRLSRFDLEQILNTLFNKFGSALFWVGESLRDSQFPVSERPVHIKLVHYDKFDTGRNYDGLRVESQDRKNGGMVKLLDRMD